MMNFVCLVVFDIFGLTMSHS